MSNINKTVLIDILREKINYLKKENTIESKSQSKELEELLYLIIKGCFDVK